MIVCGEKIRVKGDSDAPEEFLGKEGLIHVRRRRLKGSSMYTYEIRFFDTKLNHPIMGTVDGFEEEQLEVI